MSIEKVVNKFRIIFKSCKFAYEHDNDVEKYVIYMNDFKVYRSTKFNLMSGKLKEKCDFFVCYLKKI